MSKAAVQAKLKDWQQGMVQLLQGHDACIHVQRDHWQHQAGGGGESCVLGGGQHFEHAGIHFSHIQAKQLPPAATIRRPELVNCPFEVMGVSMIVHPLNPHIPTCHANGRYFEVTQEDGSIVWWFGGGFDLTPYYGDVDDCVLWHTHAKAACDVLRPEAYTSFKKQCDDYFYLKHRQEPRGIGGIFFDDLSEGGFDHAFAFIQAMMTHFTEAYGQIVERRIGQAWTEEERSFQLYRRGRYVEFNLLYDRGTLFGLQSGGRTESILASLPPLVRWEYQYTPAPGTRESRLVDDFLTPKDWLAAS